MGSISGGVLALSALSVALIGAAPAFAEGSPTLVDQVVTLVNQRRAEGGLRPLRSNAQLQQAAQSYAEYMARAGTFSHTGSDGSTPWSRMAAAGYHGSVMGENIARGFQTAGAVMDVWMNSPGHRANIMSADYNEIGVGVAVTDAGDYWVQDFGAGEFDTSTPAAPLGPVITGISPYYARMGDPIAINGQRFGTERGTVTFSGGKDGEASSWADTRIVCTVPFGAATGMLYVQTRAGTSAGSYFYVLLPAGTDPFLQRVSPSTGPAGTTVWVYGQRLGATPGKVTFNGVPAAVTNWSPSGYYLQAIVPQGSASGPVVVTRASDGAKTNGMSFTIPATGAQPAAQPQPPTAINPPAPPTGPPARPPVVATPAPPPSNPHQGYSPYRRRSYSPFGWYRYRRP